MKRCPNCGAPIQHYYNYHCEYCGTFLKNTEEEIKQKKYIEFWESEVQKHLDNNDIMQAVGCRLLANHLRESIGEKKNHE